MLTAIVIVAGCAACSELSESWPGFVARHSADTLWALMVFLGLGLLFPTLSTASIACVVLVFAFGVEGSQLYHAPWIDAFRDTLVGALTIGSHFSWSACACYVVGCGAAALAEVTGLTRHDTPADVPGHTDNRIGADNNAVANGSGAPVAGTASALGQEQRKGAT